jgi:hypothetical protein
MSELGLCRKLYIDNREIALFSSNMLVYVDGDYANNICRYMDNGINFPPDVPFSAHNVSAHTSNEGKIEAILNFYQSTYPGRARVVWCSGDANDSCDDKG